MNIVKRNEIADVALSEMADGEVFEWGERRKPHMKTDQTDAGEIMSVNLVTGETVWIPEEQHVTPREDAVVVLQ